MKETDLKEAFDAKYPEVTPFVKTWMDGVQTLIREQERERCAKVCEAHIVILSRGHPASDLLIQRTLEVAAAAIRLGEG